MAAWLLALGIGSPAYALDVEVRHLGYRQTYRLQPGEQLSDTWLAVPIAPPRPKGESRRAKRKRRADIQLALGVERVGEGALAVMVRVEQTDSGGQTSFTAAPIVLVPEHNPVGRVMVGDEVVLDPPNKQRRIPRPTLEITVLPDNYLTEDVIRVGDPRLPSR